MMTDPLAEALISFKVANIGWGWDEIAKTAREFIANEIESQAEPFRFRPDGSIEATESFSGMLKASRIARGGNDD
jgi:hypothetical protein